jgi:putative transposase
MRETIESIPVTRPEPSAAAPQGLCLDKGYDCEEAHALAAEYGYEGHVRPIREDRRAKRRPGRRKARRWVVERSHSWLNRFRRILVRWEKKARNYLAMLHLACATVAYRAAGLLG